MSDPEKAMDWGGVPGEEDAEDIEEVEVVADNKKSNYAAVTAQLMKNPELLAALQSKLGSIVGTPSGYIASLPKPVKRRIKALKKLQLETTNIEAKFFQEINALECKYAKLYQPFYDKRAQITAGLYEPTDEESKWSSEDEKEEEELADEAQNKLKIEEPHSNVNGISEFWLTIFKNVETLAEMVQDHDEPILKHLKDIKVKMSEADPMGFSLEFHFEPNEYFSNSILTKEYEMKCAPDEGEPFSFEGPEIIKCKGCPIDWKKGKNVTVKMIKKKQKHKSRGSVRTITKTVQNDSFFNFFNPPAIPEDEETEVDEETQALLAADFEIGHYIRERIVPRAVLYFTGEALDDEEYDEEDGEEEDDDNDDDDDDENDPDFNPNAEDGDKKGQAVSDCKQQ